MKPAKCVLWNLAVAIFTICRVAIADDRAVPNEHQSRTIKSGGLDRHYLLHVPQNLTPSNRVPLVIMLHGGGGSSQGAVRETGWSAKADKCGFIAAYPDAMPPDRTKPGKFRGNPQTWNDGSGRFVSEKDSIDDVAFIRATIEDIATRFPIDRKRIYVTGFSNGASMTFRVGAELSDIVAAIAPVAGELWPSDIKPKRGVPMCYITGANDPLNPLAGGRLRFNLGGKEKAPVQDSIDKWVKAIGAPAQPASNSTTNGVKKIRYAPGRNNSEVIFITIEGQGHIWPGGVNQLPEFMVGKPTDKLNATDTIWDFFASHPRD